MTPIRTNKPVFFGNNGEVLKSGYIHIGQPNQDPRNFPKTVTFQDSAGGQFTAAQPLRTNAQGQIAYNGKAIIALVDGNYSMLVQDSNQVQIKDGWTPLIEASAAESSVSSVIYRTLLSDLKSVNVTPGQYVENIGKTTAQDGEGALWLVVSNTGSPGDDVDLIDFTNGTQGVRIENQVYGNRDEFLQVANNLQEIEDSGAPAQFAARGNLGLFDTENIADFAITEDKLEDDSVTSDKIPTDAVLAAQVKTRSQLYPVSVAATSTVIDITSTPGFIITLAYLRSGGDEAEAVTLRLESAGAVTKAFIQFAGGGPNTGDLVVNYIASS